MSRRRPETSTARWSRRDFLRGCGVAGAALCSSGNLACSSDSSDSRPRNILLITGDDLGWRDLSAAGNPNLRTPNLDRLLRGGVSFSNAFDVTSTCSSSRTTYATGQYPHTHGVVGLVHRLPELSLPAGTPTLASLLRGAGYWTAIEGKWHLAFPEGPEGYGYDEVMTTILSQWILDSSQTVDFIARHAGDRFFLELNYMNPHRDADGGFAPHPDHPIDPDSVEIPDYVHLPDVPGARAELAAYYSQVERMDAMIGEVLAALDEHDLVEDTLVTFISDNGIPFPGNKLNLYDRGTGTPWFFHWPRGLPAGVERPELVASVDLMPTLLEAAGVIVPSEVQGVSLWPMLRSPEVPGGHGAVFSEMTQHFSTAFPMRSVRTDRYRYLRNYSDQPTPIEGDDQPWVQEVLAMELPGYRWDAPRVHEELYDLQVDPQEQDNRIADPSLASVLEELRALLDQHMEDTADPYLGQAFEESAAP